MVDVPRSSTESSGSHAASHRPCPVPPKPQVVPAPRFRYHEAKPRKSTIRNLSPHTTLFASRNTSNSPSQNRNPSPSPAPPNVLTSPSTAPASSRPAHGSQPPHFRPYARSPASSHQLVRLPRLERHEMARGER